MRPLDDDYDGLDDFEFDSFAASRRMLRDRHHHHKSAGRKRPKAVRKERWESEGWESPDDFYDDEPQGYFGSRNEH